MGKKSIRPKKPSRDPKAGHADFDFDEDDVMDDEIDAFHKQRDVIPLDVDADIDGGSDEDMEQPVFDFKASDSDSEEDDDEAATADEANCDSIRDDDVEKNEIAKLPPLAAKIARQAKFLRQRIGGVDEDIHSGDEQEEEKRTGWGRYKNMYFGADNADFELLSSDDELRAEEDEALRMQREKAKSLSMEDFGLEDSDKDVDDDQDGKEKSLEAIFAVDKSLEKSYSDKFPETTENYVEIKKDLDALSKEEQMDIVYSSAPELVGLLSELNEALEQCEVAKSFLFKVKESKNCREEAARYLEVKQRILLAYCQAIGFYLLLKSERHSVRDHPVLARLVELKGLVEKVKQIDEKVPSETEVVKAITNKDIEIQKQESAVKESATLKPKLSNEANEMDESVKVGMSKDYGLKNVKIPEQNGQVGLQSKEMLKLRASLEDKLKQRGIYNSIKLKPCSIHNCASHAANKRLEATTDFDDEVTEPAFGHSTGNGQAAFHLTKLSQMVKTKGNKPTFVSGDDDLPQRDDIGERRRKHELRVLARAGAGLSDDENDTLANVNGNFKVNEMDNGLGNVGKVESEDEFYQEAKRQRVSKLSAKADKYLRPLLEPSSLPETETETDGKRLITHQIEKNRGLTRHRKKEIKNPRKKYKMKHKKAMIRRKGQVREIRKPSGPYGGEATGINIGVSRSIRFKN